MATQIPSDPAARNDGDSWMYRRRLQWMLGGQRYEPESDATIWHTLFGITLLDVGGFYSAGIPSLTGVLNAPPTAPATAVSSASPFAISFAGLPSPPGSAGTLYVGDPSGPGDFFRSGPIPTWPPAAPASINVLTISNHSRGSSSRFFRSWPIQLFRDEDPALSHVARRCQCAGLRHVRHRRRHGRRRHASLVSLRMPTF